MISEKTERLIRSCADWDVDPDAAVEKARVIRAYLDLVGRDREDVLIALLATLMQQAEKYPELRIRNTIKLIRQTVAISQNAIINQGVAI